jgi:hypothetical protein
VPLDPELVHALERVRVLGLELVPGAEVRSVLARKALAERRQRVRLEEAEKLQAVLVEERLNLRDREAALLHGAVLGVSPRLTVH